MSGPGTEKQPESLVCDVSERLGVLENRDFRNPLWFSWFWKAKGNVFHQKCYKMVGKPGIKENKDLKEMQVFLSYFYIALQAPFLKKCLLVV